MRLMLLIGLICILPAQVTPGNYHYNRPCTACHAPVHKNLKQYRDYWQAVHK